MIKDSDTYTFALAAALAQADSDGIELINRISISPTSTGAIVHFTVKDQKRGGNLSEAEYEWKEGKTVTVQLPYWMEK